VAAIIVDDLDEPGRVLAARRSRPLEGLRRWEFPGGKVDDAELPVPALHRELAEELNISVTVGEEFRSPDGGCWPISDTLEMRTWLARIASGIPSPGDSHDQLRWLEPLALGDLDWLEADAAVVEALQSWLGPPN
jgi:8-oxo-dGTP diphosphatase